MSSADMNATLKDTNQHFVTRAHLDAFVHPSSPDAVLYPYRRGGRRCKARGTKKLGSAMNFYRQRENGELNDRLDESRTFLETKLFASGKRTQGALSKCVYDDAFTATYEDAVELAAAAAFLFCSSPVQIHNAAMTSLLDHQVYLFNKMNSQEAKNEYAKRYGDDGGTQLAEDKQKLLKGELVADVGEENHKQLGFNAFRCLEDIIRSMLGMRMTIVDCDSRCEFVTSDNPVVRILDSSPERLGEEVWFPISHRRALWWHRRKHGDRLPLKYSQCFARNRQVIKHAHRFVYAPLPHDWIESAANDLTFNPLLGHYGTLEKAISFARPAFDQDGNPIGEIVNWMDALRAGERPEIAGL